MKLCYVLFYYDPRHVDPDPAAYLGAVRTAHDLPRELAARGHRVDVVHLYPVAGAVRRDAVRHHFVPPGPLARLLGASGSRLLRLERATVTPAGHAIRRVLSLQPDVVHCLGTSLHVNLALLLHRRGRSDGPPVVLHHHGGRPAKSFLGYRLQRYGFARAARFFFTTIEQAREHVQAGLLDDGMRRVVELMETSSRFAPMPRAEARQRSGMVGDPVFLWAARLVPIKDPLTALRGFARIAEVWSGAHLYLHYLNDDLLAELRAWVAARGLGQRVHFGGRLPYEDMEVVYNSADFLLQASRREHSGGAVLDAMACGVIPVLTDIPSFRAMTGDGSVGLLFASGEAASLARQVLDVPRSRIPSMAAAVRARFVDHLSFPTLARRLEQEYEELLAAREPA